MKTRTSNVKWATVYLLVGALPAIGFGQKAEGPSGVPPYFSELPWMEASAHAAMQRVLQVGGGLPAAVSGYLSTIRRDLDRMVEVASGPELVELESLPSYREARFAAETLIARGLSTYETGDEEGAWKDWRAAWRMGRSVRRGHDDTPGLTQVMVGVAIEGLVVTALEKLWKDKKGCAWLGNVVADEIALRAKEDLPDYDDAIENEWQSAIRELRAAARDEGAADKLWKQLDLPKRIGARKRSRFFSQSAERLSEDRKLYFAVAMQQKDLPRKSLKGDVDEKDLAEKGYHRVISRSVPSGPSAKERIEGVEAQIAALKRRVN